jgi:hypothetical protein
MNTEVKIAFRKLLSDCLLEMTSPGRDKNEILTITEKLEASVTKVIDHELHEVLTNAPGYSMSEAERVAFGTRLAITLETIAQPGMNGQRLLDLIKNFEAFIETTAEAAARRLVDKPRMRITRMRDLPN